jgi:hypothetical protein
MLRNRRRRYTALYNELWRLYYAVIIAGSGLAIVAASISRQDYVLAVGFGILTVAAVATLMLVTFRRRKPGVRIPATRQLRRPVN